jgi:CheY-like chemotaxis protein
MPTILLVDHDPLQAFLRKSILESGFPDVQRVSEAAEALCLVEQPRFADNLALVIAGHHMPGIGGPEFVAELLSRMPDLPVIVLGGSSETPGDYPGDSVYFRPRPIAADELLALTGQLMEMHHRDAA